MTTALGCLATTAVIVVLSAVLLWGVLPSTTWWQVDACLDAGGRWIEQQEVCEGAER